MERRKTDLYRLIAAFDQAFAPAEAFLPPRSGHGDHVEVGIRNLLSKVESLAWVSGVGPQGGGRYVGCATRELKQGIAVLDKLRIRSGRNGVLYRARAPLSLPSYGLGAERPRESLPRSSTRTRAPVVRRKQMGAIRCEAHRANKIRGHGSEAPSTSRLAEAKTVQGPRPFGPELREARKASRILQLSA